MVHNYTGQSDIALALVCPRQNQLSPVARNESDASYSVTRCNLRILMPTAIILSWPLQGIPLFALPLADWSLLPISFR